jgi:hypothetical protein
MFHELKKLDFVNHLILGYAKTLAPNAALGSLTD